MTDAPKPEPLAGDFGFLEMLGQQWDEAQRRIVEADAKRAREAGQAAIERELGVKGEG